MAEIFVSTLGEFGLDAWAELMARFPRFANRAIQSSLRYEGGRLQKIIKSSIIQGGAPGQPWPPLQPHTLAILAARRRQARWAAQKSKSRMINGVRVYSKVRASTVAKYRGHTERDPGGVKPLRKLAGATRYYYDDSIKTVTIGFLDQRNRGLGKMQAAGFTKTVDRRMGKLLAAFGFPVKTGTVLRTPPRPIVGPIFDQERGNIIRNVQVNAVNNIYRYLTGRPKDWDKKPESTGTAI